MLRWSNDDVVSWGSVPAMGTRPPGTRPSACPAYPGAVWKAGSGTSGWGSAARCCWQGAGNGMRGRREGAQETGVGVGHSLGSCPDRPCPCAPAVGPTWAPASGAGGSRGGGCGPGCHQRHGLEWQQQQWDCYCEILHQHRQLLTYGTCAEHRLGARHTHHLLPLNPLCGRLPSHPPAFIRPSRLAGVVHGGGAGRQQRGVSDACRTGCAVHNVRHRISLFRSV